MELTETPQNLHADTFIINDSILSSPTLRLLVTRESIQVRFRAARDIRGICNEYLTVEEILNANEKVAKLLLLQGYSYSITESKHFVLLDNLLKNNVDMYIAIILAFNNKKNPVNVSCLSFLIEIYETPRSSGFADDRNSSLFVTICKYLLDHYEFDVSIFDIPDNVKKSIEDYRRTRYSCKNIKSAKVNQC
jgi:hypothetical protein